MRSGLPVSPNGRASISATLVNKLKTSTVVACQRWLTVFATQVRGVDLWNLHDDFRVVND
jgi:hypothetical protein